MKKALGQTVRDIKRGVNKKVLKVPSIEQKVLDATSNEPWGPHGSLLADIAQASRNYHEYQMIMSVIWKRINDTGKNWRHVYKALTVLEYLVAHGSERCIDDIREHAYQISTLSDFQYIDSSGKDQGNNVRKKSQSLVVLVNDKESIQEVRQKAASNKDKYRGSVHSRAGSMSSSGGYGDRSDDDRYEGRYGNRDDDRNGSGRERDWSSRDDDRNGRHGDTYGREGDRNGRYSEERYDREGYRDYDYQGRSQSVDDHHYGSRSRSADRYRDRDFEDDCQYSSRGSVAKADDHSQDGSTSTRLEHKYSEQNLGAPPNYEEVVGTNRSPTYNERDRESTSASAPKASSPTGTSPSHIATTFPPPVPASPPAPAQAQNSNKEVDGFDEFDPRGSFSATPTISDGFAPATSSGTEMDLLGSLSESFPPNSLALVPVNEPIMTPEANAPANFGSASTLAPSASDPTISNQPFDDPFGDGPFKATPSPDIVSAQNHYMLSGPSGLQPPLTNPQFLQLDISTPNPDFDILADILPQSAPSSFGNIQSGYPVPPGHSVSHTAFPPQTNEPISQLGPPSVNAPQNSFPPQSNHSSGFFTQPGQRSLPTTLQSAESVPHNSFPGQPMALTYPVQAAQTTQIGVHYQNGQPMALSGYSAQMGFPQAGVQAPLAQPNPPNSNLYRAYHSQMPAVMHAVPPSSSGPIMNQNFLSQSYSAVPVASTGSSAIGPQPSKDKFETKSTVWADTLSRGLVNLNISGSKTNPLADIGVDFDALNRKEKRMAKPTTDTVTSTITMGKAMGSGSGIGRAGAGVIRPPQNPMVSPGVGGYGINQQGRGMNMPGNMGMGINMPGNMGMGMGMGMGIGMNMPGNMGMGMNMPGNMGMNMNMGQSMQQQAGFPPGGYMPMRGSGNYGQNPYGGGYQ